MTNHIDTTGVELVNIDTSTVPTMGVTDVALAEMRANYEGLRSTDKESHKAVKAACRDVKSTRTRVEAERVRLKAPALDWGRRVDAEAKRITLALQAIEAPIDESRKAYDAAAKAAKAAEIAAEQKLQRERTAKIDGYSRMALEFGSHRSPGDIAHEMARLNAFAPTMEEFGEAMIMRAKLVHDQAFKAMGSAHEIATERTAREGREMAERIEARKVAEREAEERAAQAAAEAEARRVIAEREAEEREREQAAARAALEAQLEAKAIADAELHRVKEALADEKAAREAAEDAKAEAERAAQAEQARIRGEAEAARVQAEQAAQAEADALRDRLAAQQRQAEQDARRAEIDTAAANSEAEFAADQRQAAALKQAAAERDDDDDDDDDLGTRAENLATLLGDTGEDPFVMIVGLQDERDRLAGKLLGAEQRLSSGEHAGHWKIYGDAAGASPIASLLDALRSDRGYLLGWHANLAMSTSDALVNLDGNMVGQLEIDDRWLAGQEAARRFVATLFRGQPNPPKPITNDEVRGGGHVAREE